MKPKEFKQLLEKRENFKFRYAGYVDVFEVRFGVDEGKNLTFLVDWVYCQASDFSMSIIPNDYKAGDYLVRYLGSVKVTGKMVVSKIELIS